MGTRLFNVSVQVRSGVITNFIAQELNNGQSRLETQNKTFRMWLIYRMFSISPAPDSDQCTFHRRVYTLTHHVQHMGNAFPLSCSMCAASAPNMLAASDRRKCAQPGSNDTIVSDDTVTVRSVARIAQHDPFLRWSHQHVCVWYAGTHFAHPHRQSSIDDDDNGGTARSMRAHV